MLSRLTLVAALLATTARAQEMRNISVGVVLDFGYGSAAVGDSLLGEVGGQFVGLRSFRDRRWLLQWDAVVAARGGILGNTLPYTGLAGARTLASGEIGYRFLHERRFSPYLGGRLDGALSVMTRPGTPLSELNSLNSVDGVGGVDARGALRVTAGGAFLDGARSLLIVAFFQEALRAPGITTPGAAFSEGGVALRFDIARRLTAQVEALAGRTPPSENAALATTNQTTVAGFSALVRVLFRRGAWLTLSGGYSREFDHRTYRNSALAYDTASAPTFSLNLLVGISLDRKERIWK